MVPRAGKTALKPLNYKIKSAVFCTFFMRFSHKLFERKTSEFVKKDTLSYSPDGSGILFIEPDLLLYKKIKRTAGRVSE